MKHRGCILDFTHERNKDLMRAYREQLHKASYIVMPEIFEKVANSPAARFWVSEERATIIVSAMLAGKEPRNMRPSKREMFEEILYRYKLLKAQFPKKSVFEIVTKVVNQPAPKFYMTPRTVGEFIYRIRNGWYDTRQYDRYKKKKE